jgi:tetratricopeptide (TPR) repeat protein
MRTKNRVVVAVACLLGCCASAVAGDLIQRKDGSFMPPLKGGGSTPTSSDFEASNYQVIDATIDEVLVHQVIAGKNQKLNMKSADVLEIWLEQRDYPPEWKQAVELANAGNNKDAAKIFRAIAETKQIPIHPVVRQKAWLFCARSLRNQGLVNDADAAYESLLKAFPTTFYTRSLWGDRWQMWMDAGNEEKALAAIDQLLKLPGVTDADKLEAEFARITIALRKAVAAKDTGAIQKCLDGYKTIANDTQGRPDLASVNNLAKIGQGNCFLELNNVAGAKGIFEDLSQRGTSNAVLAAAWSGLGETWFKDNNVKGFKEAQRCFLRASLLYDEGAPGEVVAKALYYAGECFYRLQEGEDWKLRARKELAACYNRFPNSPWAAQARKLWQAIPK